MSEFTKALVVSPLADGRTWVLLEPFSYDVGTERQRRYYPGAGAVHDRFRQRAPHLLDRLPAWGRYGNAAVIHDFGYPEPDPPPGRVTGSSLKAWRYLG